MANSSDTFKTGEKAIQDGEYTCLNCAQMGKSTTIQVSRGSIFPHCEDCESKDATYRLAGTPVQR